VGGFCAGGGWGGGGGVETTVVDVDWEGEVW